MKKLLLIGLGACAALCCSPRLEAQRAALRTNALALATGNLNLEASHMIGQRWTAHLMLQAKPFSYPLPVPIGLLRWAEGLDQGTSRLSEFGTIKHTEHYTIEPSLRYWMSGAYNRGLFFGLQATGSLFSYGGDKYSANYRKGWGAGAGLSIGYSRELSSRFNIEFELGVGGMYRSYQMVNGESGYVWDERHTDIVPTLSRLGVSLVYTL